MIAFSFFFLWNYLSTPDTINQELKNFQKGGEQALNDLNALPSVNLTEEGDNYIVTDTLSEGIEITYPNQKEEEKEKKPQTKVSLPKDYTQPIEIKLDDQRVITIKDENNTGYSSDTLTQEQVQKETKNNFFSQFLKKQEHTNTYLRYQNDRKTLLYSYQRERSSGERKLKHWTFYTHGTGEEKESYTIDNARLNKNENGDIELFFQTEQDLKNQAAAKEVDPSLMDRAMRTLEKENAINPPAGGQNPDLLIPRPYYYDKDGNYQEAEWSVKENKLTLSIKTTPDKYPLSVDPTLAFTAPGVSNGGSSISATAANYQFGEAMATGDLNADGRTDLVVGAWGGFSSTSSRFVYIFYNDGSYTSVSDTADVIIQTTDVTDHFGRVLTTGDLNADGKTDLIVGAGNGTRTYVFYNDGSYPATSAGADVTITTGASVVDLTTGDLNADGRTDLVIGDSSDATFTGKVYILYNDGSIPTNVSSSDVTITGETTNNYFGYSLATGDLNADGKVDLAVGAFGYSSSAGRTYIFYNDGSIPTTAATADVAITGTGTEGFGNKIATGDLNADGKTDLFGGGDINSYGLVYIFYNDGSYPTSVSSADVNISNATNITSRFGYAFSAADFNGDGRADLAVGAQGYSGTTGRTYIFYNDGAYPSNGSGADVMITGEGSSTSFGRALASGDMNADGKIDLVVSAEDYGATDGKAYIFYSQNGILNTNRDITGEATSNSFGVALTSGDFNADGRVDLAVGASGYSTSTGRAYIFYNDGSIPTTAATADVIITGEASSAFGASLVAGDFNANGTVDLAVGANTYSTSTGRAYIFYNDGSIPTTAATADVIITGEASSQFGDALAVGDLNTDSTVDLAVAASTYSSSAGRAYIFYNDGSIPTTAVTADVIINGQSLSVLKNLAIGDFNADGRVDLAAGGSGYSSTGRAYIFYNDGSYPTTAASADVFIDGESSSSFGSAVVAGDFNGNGTVDLAVGGSGYSSAGRAYIFYNDGSIPTTAATADVIITGEATGNFGFSFAAGDFNMDGRVDLAVGAYTKSSSTGRAYIFYNDDSIPTTAATADDIIIGGASSDNFSIGLTAGDLNADGKTDLIVGASGYTTSTGRVYFYEGRDNYAWILQQQPLGTTRVSPQVTGEELRITGEESSYFGWTLASGDLNADGKADLAVGATAAGGNGRTYVFYNDGDYVSYVLSADLIITGQSSGNGFGSSLTTGDFNSDGKIDLAAGAPSYSSTAGRVYVFYNDGSYPSTAASADVIITGEASSALGTSLASGDLNADGKVDLIGGAFNYSSITGRAYIFYNGSIITEAATGADVIITGDATSYFGNALATGDLNADGKGDLAVGANGYSSSTGRAYIFYGDGSIPTTAATADISIDGQGLSASFGEFLTTGDLNADSKTDLIVGAKNYSSSTGRAYVFHNDGSIPTTAATADVIITGEASSNFFGSAFATGDLNADGKTDLVVGGRGYSSSIGRAYIFYNGSITTENASGADVTISGESGSALGGSLMASDFNNDGKGDLAVGAYNYSSNRGRVYMYTFNDSMTAGAATGDYFGGFVTAGDLNADGKVDLAVGARSYSTSTGRTYIFYGGSAIDTTPSTADVTITGEASSSFGAYLVANTDFNADGKIDLVVGAWGYTTNTGRAYIFYNDGTIPTTAATADVTITGAATSDYFGIALAAGDMNADGKADLVVGANGASKTYIYYNDGSIPTTAATADVTITGGGSDAFGTALATGDVNADGKGDLIASALNYSTNGGAFIFYGDGSIPTTTGTADVTITGETGGGFGYYKSLATGDFNADGEIDLAVGGYGYSSSTGRAYIFYNDGSIPTTGATADVIIAASTTGQSFGDTLTAGDLNADGKTDLVVGSWDSSSLTDNVYVFYNDGTYPSLASSAEKIFSGSTTAEDFGLAVAVSDVNIDGIPDLVVGAPVYSSSIGRVYTFISEIAVTQPETKAAEFKGSSGIIKGSFELK